MSADLHNIDKAIEFYDDRYEDGYMEEWDDDKKRKVEEIITSLNLPKSGKALDFGCGNGVFTTIIKSCLPNWEVYGVEISPIAVKNASKKIPQCHFFTGGKSIEYKNTFDFIFSHHVLEHVQNMTETIGQINDYLKPTSNQLHILPCGNEGSYEYKICLLRKNGIETSKGNRFFFEEPGHLRRMNSAELTDQMNQKGFQLKNEFYANQYFGAINWITKASPRFVKKLTDHTEAVNEKSAAALKQIKKELLRLTYLQFAYSKYWHIKSKWKKNISDYLKLTLLFFPAMLSKPTFEKYNKLAANEWNEHKHQLNGSEMYLVFERK